jgi:HTH-type transcriptional regulator / antitoxin HigA
MDIRPIRTDEDHAAALAEIERLWGAEPSTPEGDRLDVLATLVEAYEERRWPIEPPDPIELIRFAISEMGRSQAELAKLLGSRSRASEILSRKRPLTVDMVHKISEAWGLPASVLVRPYRLDAVQEA